MTTPATQAARLRELSLIEATLSERGVSLPKVLPSRQRRTIPMEDRTLNPYQWACKYRRIDGKPFSLARHRPFMQVYADDHAHKVIMKCAQVGASEMAVSCTLHALDVGAYYWGTGKRGLNVAYLFPTGKALSDFSKERLSPTKDEHVHIAELFGGGFDDITFKQAGESFLYLRSAYLASQGGGRKNNAAAEQLLSFPADMLILDEFDRMNSAAVELARKRMRASVVKRELNISTPTVPGRGVHAAYALSDRHVWEVPCGSCGTYTELDFFRDVQARKQGPGHTATGYETWREWEREALAQADFMTVCPSCGGLLDRFGAGRWTAQAPEVQTIRGYHLPALAFPMVDLRELALHAVSDDPTVQEEFYRSDLGIPYAAEGAGISDAMLDDLPEPDAHADMSKGLVLGVDVGARFHYCATAGTLGKPDASRTVVAMGSVNSWDELDRLLSRLKPRRTIIDAAPELHATKTFAESHKGVYRAYYTSDRSQKGQLFRMDETEGVVYINRTMAMDALYARIAGGLDTWAEGISRHGEVRAHLRAPQRSVIKKDDGELVPVWTHTAPDHLFHAALYAMVASQLKLARSDAASAVLVGSAHGWMP